MGKCPELEVIKRLTDSWSFSTNRLRVFGSFGPTIVGEWGQADTDCTPYLNNVKIVISVDRLAERLLTYFFYIIGRRWLALGRNSEYHRWYSSEHT